VRRPVLLNLQVPDKDRRQAVELVTRLAQHRAGVVVGLSFVCRMASGE
jgi:hypothetical protein